MHRRLIYLVLALAAAAASLIPAPKAEAACKQICCPGEPPHCILCCSSPCPEIYCGPY